MLHVWGAGRERTDRRGVCDATPKREEADQHESAADLETLVVEIAVWHSVGREMKRNPEQHRGAPRAEGSAKGSARGDVHDDDHKLVDTSPMTST